MNLPAQLASQREAIDKFYASQNAEADAADDAAAVDDAEDISVEDEAGQADAAPEEAPAKAEDFEQKYRSLQGMYNAEVPRLHAQNRELKQRLDQMEQLLGTVSSSQTPADNPGEAPAQPTYITQRDVDEYGESIDVMRRAAKEEAAAYQREISDLRNMVTSLQSQLVPQVNQLSQRQAVSSEQAFWSELQASVPNWKTTNDNQDFQSWLLEIDPLTGISRQTYLEDAQRNLDARRVAAFFTGWPGYQPEGQAPARGQRSADELSRQVAPGRGRSGGARQSAAGSDKAYSRSDSAAFYGDVRTGKYKGRDDERKRIERDIFAAQRDGRITDG